MMSEWTPAAMETERLHRLREEAKGICPDSGEPFIECIHGPCDCFLTDVTIETYIKGCKAELAKHDVKK